LRVIRTANFLLDGRRSGGEHGRGTLIKNEAAKMDGQGQLGLGPGFLHHRIFSGGKEKTVQPGTSGILGLVIGIGREPFLKESTTLGVQYMRSRGKKGEEQIKKGK